MPTTDDTSVPDGGFSATVPTVNFHRRPHMPTVSFVQQEWSALDRDRPALVFPGHRSKRLLAYEAEIRIEATDKDVEKVWFTDRAYTEGGAVTKTALGDSMREWGWARVLRIAVTPHLGMGHPVHRRPDGTEYEVVGTPDEHIVRIASLPAPPD